MFSTVTELLLPQDFSPSSGFRTLKKQSSSKETAIQRLSNRERNLDMSHFISKQFHENLKTSNSLSQYVTNLSPLQTATYSSQTSHSLLRRTVEYSRFEYLPFLRFSLLFSTSCDLELQSLKCNWKRSEKTFKYTKTPFFVTTRPHYQEPIANTTGDSTCKYQSN